MRVLVDTNVYVASLTDEPERGETATALLNTDRHTICTSLLTLMELRTVLTKKKQRDKETVETTIQEIGENTVLYGPELSDLIDAYDLQRTTLLYPVDCIQLAFAQSEEMVLASFDSELIKHGAFPPDELL